MKMHCGQARDELALEVGQDLETGLSEELRLHLSECPECCRAWLALQESHAHLQHLKHDSPVVESPGLWQDVEIAIRGRGLKPERSSFPSRVLGVAVGVLFTVFFLDSFRSSVSDDQTLLIGLPFEAEPASPEAPYQPQWPPLVLADPELVEVELVGWPAGADDGVSPDAMPEVRRVRWRSSSRPLALVPHQFVHQPIRRPGLALPPPQMRPWRRSSGIPIARTTHEILRTGVDADF